MRSTSRRLTAMLSVFVLMLAFGITGAAAQVPFPDAEFNAFATGSSIHAYLLQQGDESDSATRAIQADAGFVGAAADSQGLNGPRENDMRMRVHPDIPGQNTYARSSSLEGGLGVVVPDGPAAGTGLYLWAPGEEDPLVTWGGSGERPGPLDASAPPRDHVVNEVLEADLDPVAYAQLLHAEAFADWDDGCVPFLSQAFAEATNVQLLDAGSDAEENGNGLEEPVAQTQEIRSYSATYLGPQVGPADADGERGQLGDFAAVYAESNQTTADVTLFEGQETEFTVRIDGVQVLRAVATGIDGGAYIEYTAPLVTIETPDGTVLEIDVAGTGGTVRLPPLEEGEEGPLLAEISVFDEPYESEVSADGTYAAAKADLVRIELAGLPELGQAASIRIGHMEVEAEAPAGGIICEVPMAKSVNPTAVEAGDTFTFTITVDNPYDCDITGRVVDEISVEEGDVSWTVISTDPEADEVSDTRIVWEDVLIEAGGTATFTITLEVDPDSASGVLRDDVRLEDALCEALPVYGDADVIAGMPVVGEAEVVGPEVGEAAAAPPVLPATGGAPATALVALLLIGAGLLVSRSRRPNEI